MKYGRLTVDQREMLFLAGGAAFLAWLVFRNLPAIAQSTTRTAIETAGSVVAGAAEAIGETVGVPLTSQTQCQADIAAGNTWAASFDCPAGDFLRYVFGPGPQAGG